MEYTMERTNPSIKEYVDRKECRHCHTLECPTLCVDCGRCQACQCSPNCVTRAPIVDPWPSPGPIDPVEL